MANRHFVTVLGTGNYSECVYETEDRQFAYKTPFVQIAVLKHIMSEYKRGDRITVFATEKAEQKNWKNTVENQNSVSKQKQIHKKLKFGKKTIHLKLQMESRDSHAGHNGTLPKRTIKKGLDALLQKEFPDVKREIVRIPEGKNSQELEQIFECIYESLSMKENVFFDFTHGLRNLPMQVLAVVNYAKVLKGVNIKGLYYGAFDLGKFQEDGLRHVQILDMSFCSTMQDWTSAAEAFVKTGSSNQIKDLYQSQNDTMNADSQYKDILDSLYDLTNCLETSRGVIDSSNRPDAARPNSKNSTYYAYQRFLHKYNELHTTERPAKEFFTIDQPIERLIEYIYKDVQILGSTRLFLEKDGQRFEMKYTALGMASIQWAMEKNLIQQGFTALNETIISYVCELYDVPPKIWFTREAVRKTLRSVSVDTEDEKYPLDVREEYWIPDWEKNIGNVNEDLENKTKNILLNLPEQVFMLSKQVSNYRNSLNHFGFLKTGELINYVSLKANLVASYKQMKLIIKETPGII